MNEKYQIISVNGQFINRSDFEISLDNRAFRFGDGLFETMHANGMRVQFLEDHFKRLMQGAELLQLDLPREFTLVYLNKHIQGLLSRCKLYQGAKVRLMVYRSGAGLYIPQSNVAEIVIEAEYISKGPYEMNENGLVIDVYPETLFVNNKLAPFKTINALPYVLAGLFVKSNNLNDAILMSADGRLIEATSSNLFCLKDKQLFTPDLNTGCVNGVMRRNILIIAKQLGYDVKDNALLTEQALLKMDEVFLTNAISGISWVTGFKNRRYYKRYSTKILNELNKQFD